MVRSFDMVCCFGNLSFTIFFFATVSFFFTRIVVLKWFVIPKQFVVVKYFQFITSFYLIPFMFLVRFVVLTQFVMTRLVLLTWFIFDIDSWIWGCLLFLTQVVDFETVLILDIICCFRHCCFWHDLLLLTRFAVFDTVCFLWHGLLFLTMLAICDMDCSFLTMFVAFGMACYFFFTSVYCFWLSLLILSFAWPLMFWYGYFSNGLQFQTWFVGLGLLILKLRPYFFLHGLLFSCGLLFILYCLLFCHCSAFFLFLYLSYNVCSFDTVYFFDTFMMAWCFDMICSFHTV